MTQDHTLFPGSGTGVEDFVNRPPGFWPRIAPRAAAKLIEGSPARIAFHLGQDYEFVQALAEIKRNVPRARWNRILKRLDPGLWVSVIGGDPWDPLVLCNGGVGIRNLHRVISLDLEDGTSVSSAKPEQLRRQVRTVLRRAAAAGDRTTVLAHHRSTGLVYTTQLPADCAFEGQTVLFTAARHLKRLSILGVAPADPGAQLALRLYRDPVCLYSLSRIARFVAPGMDVSRLPIAYLAGVDEVNHDRTNFWVFSETGLLPLCERAG